MSRIRGKNTLIELQVFRFLRSRKIKFKKHHKLPGSPDAAILSTKKAIFIDGDFWHGWKLSQRRAKLPSYWARKIGSNVKRDRKNRARLRRLGWKVLRVWEHDLEKNVLKTEARIASFLEG